jgi:hypothetical protein
VEIVGSQASGSQASGARLRSLLWWLIPIVFLFWLYFNGLRTWFVADDFAWLGLIRDVHNFRDLLRELFAPAAQGTIRPWSERGFFLLFESAFGLDSLPFHICAFVTMAVDVTLVAWMARRITGSPAAGFFAAVLWIANTALATVMAWSAAYNEALCALFLLVATALFIRYAETGRRVFWWWQLVVFTLGFGALEVNVVYPALAAAYALFVASPEKKRKLLVSLTPLFCVSVVYFLVHRALAPLPTSGPYAVHIDRRVFATLGVYWKWSLLPAGWRDVGHSGRTAVAIVGILTLALAVFFIREVARRRYAVLFFGCWFLITLAPMLPLPDHRSDYYITIPLIGLAMFGGLGIAEALRGTWIRRGSALLCLVVYLGAMIPASREASRWWLGRSLPVRGLVLGVAAAHETHPEKTIVLDGITSSLYDDAIADSPFYALGLYNVYLTPGSGDRIHPRTGWEKLSHMVLDPLTMRKAVAHEQVVIYSDVGDHLRNITEEWERLAFNPNSASDQRTNERRDLLPRRVEVGNPLFAYLLGPEWFPVESPGFRWMPRRATVQLGGPVSAKEKLSVEGDCPVLQLNGGFEHLSVSVDGMPLADARIGGTENHFRRLFDVPPSLAGRESVKVAISVDRVLHEPGGRELGLVLGTVAFE